MGAGAASYLGLQAGEMRRAPACAQVPAPVSPVRCGGQGRELRSSSEREVGAGGGKSQPPAARLCRWWCGAAAGARCEARGRCG